MTDRRKSLEQGARRMNKTARSQMQDDGIVWFVVSVMTGKEYLAQRMLKKWGAIAYLPLCRKWRRVNRFTREKERFAYPALPGCLFLGLPANDQRWFDLFSLKVVYGVLGIGGVPKPLSSERLQAFIEHNGPKFEVPDEQQFMRTYHEFNAGDRVQIVDGPFDGHVVDVKDIKGRYAYILINLLGSTQDVAISLDKLEKAA